MAGWLSGSECECGESARIARLVCCPPQLARHGAAVACGGRASWTGSCATRPDARRRTLATGGLRSALVVTSCAVRAVGSLALHEDAASRRRGFPYNGASSSVPRTMRSPPPLSHPPPPPILLLAALNTTTCLCKHVARAVGSLLNPGDFVDGMRCFRCCVHGVDVRHSCRDMPKCSQYFLLPATGNHADTLETLALLEKLDALVRGPPTLPHTLTQFDKQTPRTHFRTLFFHQITVHMFNRSLLHRAPARLL